MSLLQTLAAESWGVEWGQTAVGGSSAVPLSSLGDRQAISAVCTPVSSPVRRGRRIVPEPLPCRDLVSQVSSACISVLLTSLSCADPRPQTQAGSRSFVSQTLTTAPGSASTQSPTLPNHSEQTRRFLSFTHAILPLGLEFFQPLFWKLENPDFRRNSGTSSSRKPSVTSS